MSQRQYRINKVIYFHIKARSFCNIALLNIGFVIVSRKSIFSMQTVLHESITDTDSLTFSFSASALRVARAETRLTVYRSSYIRVRSYLASLFPPRFLMTIDKSCIVASIVIIILS